MNPEDQVFTREPFQFDAVANWQDGMPQKEVSYVVPDNKRLVIENISAKLECPMGQVILSTHVKTIVNDVVAYYYVFVPRTGNYENLVDVYSGGQQVRVYADPGTAVTVNAHKNASECRIPSTTTPPYAPMTTICISGYLISDRSPILSP